VLIQHCLVASKEGEVFFLQSLLGVITGDATVLEFISHFSKHRPPGMMPCADKATASEGDERPINDIVVRPALVFD
jgi:hypothetical protein